MTIRRAARDLMSAALIAAASLGATAGDSLSQAVPRKQEAPDKDPTVNAARYTTGLVAGSPQSTEFAVAQDIATTLATNQETGPHGEVALRVLPMVGNGGQRNVLDVLTLAGADMAIVPVVLADRLRDGRTFGDIRSKIVYVAPLFPEEFHLLVGAGVKNLSDLAGKKVSLGEDGGTAAVLGLEVLNALGVKADTVNLGLDASIDALRKGEIAGALLVSASPIDALARATQFAAVRLMPIPLTDALKRDYQQAIITHTDYPAILGVEEYVPTIAVRSALFAYDWPKRSQRYQLMELFVQTFFARFPDFLADSHHPAWRHVDLAETVPGWKRFEVADRWLAKHSNDGTVVRGTVQGATGDAVRPRSPLFPDFRRPNEDEQPTAPPQAAPQGDKQP